MHVTSEAVWQSVRFRLLGVFLGLVGLGMMLGLWLAEYRGAVCP